MDHESIKKFLNGESTPKEASEFFEWLFNKRGEQELLHSMEAEWDEMEENFKGKEELLANIQKIIDQKERHNRSSRFFLMPLLKIAASLAMIITIGWFMLKLAPQESESKPAITIQTVIKVTEQGQKLTFALPDGSMVTLNSDSKLEYDVPFTESSRKVALHGEAYFDVKTDPDKPFVVITGPLKTMAVGTSFNIKYRTDLNEIQVALLTGKINVNSENKEITLNPGEMAVFNNSSHALRKKEWDYKKNFGWKDGIMQFDKVPLVDIVPQLEMWYGVEITLPKNPVVKKHFTGSFQNEPLKHVLESLSFSYGFEYEINDRNITIKF